MEKNEKHANIGACLGALLGEQTSDCDCLQQLKDHGVITKDEFFELLKRVKS